MILLKNYGTMGKKTMIQYRKLFNFDLLWKNYETMKYTLVQLLIILNYSKV